MGRRRVTDTAFELWDGRHWWKWGEIDGLPAFAYGHAPSGLATRAQLHQQGRRLARNQDPYAVLFWQSSRFGRRTANLYRADESIPAYPETPARQESRRRAYAARFRCARGHRSDRYVDPETRLCGPCRDVADDEQVSAA